jgi:hypothetical protein
MNSARSNCQTRVEAQPDSTITRKDMQQKRYKNEGSNNNANTKEKKHHGNEHHIPRELKHPPCLTN